MFGSIQNWSDLKWSHLTFLGTAQMEVQNNQSSVTQTTFFVQALQVNKKTVSAELSTYQILAEAQWCVLHMFYNLKENDEL